MRIEPLRIHGAVRLVPTVHHDSRGYFTRTFDTASAGCAGINAKAFVQDSQSRSVRGVVRGLHVRAGGGESKLVRCARGQVLDVLVDLRPASPTYLQVETIRLDDVDHVTVYVPRGIAHGWQALSELADVCYRIDAEHDPSEDVTIRWDDEQFAVPWPVEATVMSEGDRLAQRWPEIRHALNQARPAWYDDGKRL